MASWFSPIAYRPNTDQHNSRQLVEVISHEVVHHLAIQDDLEREVLAPSWKKEGYADFVSRGSTVPLADGICLLANNKKLEDPSEWYFLFATEVKLLFADKEMSYAKLLADTRSEEEVRGAAIKYSIQQAAEMKLDCQNIMTRASWDI